MFKKSAKQFIKAFDFFSQPVTFRYGDEPEYETLTGGIFSIILIILFAIIFTSTVMSTIKKQNIDAKITSIQEEDPTFYQVGTDSFMFAVGISGLDLNSGSKWFDIYFQKRQYQGSNRTKTKLQLTKCTKQQWTKIKQNMSQLYDRMGFNSWLCPTDKTMLQLQGKYSSNFFKFYKIGVQACSNSTTTVDRPCIQNSKIQDYINQNQTFSFNFYFLNTILNPGNEEFASTYLDDTNYFPFSPTDGISANFFLSSFNIATDESIFPISSNSAKSGGISNMPTQTTTYQVKQKDYIKFYIRKSSLSLSIERSFRKLDDTFSYIGGLFSTILIMLFLISKYSEHSYELEVAKNLFHYDKNKPLRADDFNFLIFLGYLIYAIFDKINIKLPWKKMEKYHRSLEQVRKQMDIRLIMKKILYSQRMAIAVFDQAKYKILHLQQPLTLQEAEQIRKDHRLYQKLQQKFFKYKQIRQQEKRIQQQLKLKQQLKANEQNEQILTQKQNSNLRLFGPISLDQNIQETKKNSIEVKRKASIQKDQIKMQQAKSDGNQQKKQDQKDQKVDRRIRKLSQQILTLIIGDEQKKQQELNEMIHKIKLHVKTLQNEANQGDIVSLKILNRFDQKLMKIFFPQSSQKKNKIKIQNRKISAIQSRVENEQGQGQIKTSFQSLPAKGTFQNL